MADVRTARQAETVDSKRRPSIVWRTQAWFLTPAPTRTQLNLTWGRVPSCKWRHEQSTHAAQMHKHKSSRWSAGFIQLSV